MEQQVVEFQVKPDRYVAKVNKAKKKCRSDLNPEEWDRHQFAQTFDKWWQAEDTMQRISEQETSVEQFVEKFERPGLPVVITGIPDSWPAKRNWLLQNLVDRYGSYRFRCGEDDEGYGVYIKFKYYLKYALETKDDSPMYIFDSSFGERVGTRHLLEDYTPPKYFREDLFKLVGEKRRPPYKWVVIGPPRSGTNIHIDPLGTSAWNTLLSGHKRWALFPPDTPKSLIDPPKMEDEAVVWFERMFEKTQSSSWEGPKPITIIQKPGETVFVPGGWWHVVMNLDMAVAITQNFCSSANFDQVWLKTRSSRPKFSKKFSDQIAANFPALHQRIIELEAIPREEDSSSSSSSSSESEEEPCDCKMCREKHQQK